MTDPGLTNRLRQHSRRAGLAVGLSMALTIAVCLGGFVYIYARVDPFLSDFVSVDATQEPEDQPPATRQAAPDDDDEGGGGSEVAAAEPDDPEPTPTPEPEPTPTPEGFQPDYQSSSQAQINLRAGPGTDFEVVTVLTLAQPLQYLNEDAPTDNPAADGDRWMHFQTESGEEGWIREIDAEPLQ